MMFSFYTLAASSILYTCQTMHCDFQDALLQRYNDFL